MSTSARWAAPGSAARLGFAAGQVVQEFGYDADVDDDFRFALEDHSRPPSSRTRTTATSRMPFSSGGATGDGDLVDAVVDGLTNLAEAGFIVVLTPKAGRAGHLDASELEEAATTAGLHTSGAVNACEDGTATRLVAPRTARR